MPRTQYYTATSIDGYIADQDNSLGWLFQAESSADKDDRFTTFFSNVGAMAMGSTTYEWVLEHEHLLAHPEKWRAYYGTTPCWVFSSRKLPVIPDANLTFVRGEVQGVHAQMMSAAAGKNIWLAGGGDLVGQFADHGLLDDIFLGVAPVFLGGGAPLLPRRLLAPDVALTSVEHDENFVFLTYQMRP